MNRELSNTYDVARTAVGLAVPAATHDFAVVLGVEVCDFEVGAAVELDDLVVCVEGAAAVDVACAGVLLKNMSASTYTEFDEARTYDGDGVFTDVAVPDVVECASAQAVNAFSLVGPDDDVGEGTAFFDDEHGVITTGLCLILAYTGWGFEVSTCSPRKARM